MKTRKLAILIIFICSALSFCYGVIAVKYKTFPFQLLRTVKKTFIGESIDRGPYYYHKKSFFEAHGQDKYDIVFIGDSITDDAEWQDLFPDFKIANRGIRGDTTKGILERMNSILSTNAEKAFIMVGINDFNRGQSVDSVYSNYKRILEELTAKGFSVYIQSTIFAGAKASHVNKDIASLNRKLQLLTNDNSLMTYIDLNKSLAPHGLLKRKYSRDDVHLNASGYGVWKAAINDLF